MHGMDIENAPRLVIENVQPAVDGGRYAVKRARGDVLRVEATVYRDGHDLIRARLCYRGPGDDVWRSTPMRYERNFDRCTGCFAVDRVGRWQYTVEAWTDHFGTWWQDLRKKLGVGVAEHMDL